MAFLKLGIIGKPLGHSLSPLLHQMLLERCGLQGEYQKYECDEAELSTTIATLASNGIRGLNVTIPHKVAVLQAVHQLSPQAQLAGAVNTLVFESPEHIIGHNTDIQGFIHGFPQAVQSRLPGQHVLLLGAGGSARAVLLGLMQAKVARITIAARNLEKAHALANTAQAAIPVLGHSVQAEAIEMSTLNDLSRYEGVVNTTPVGMHPHAGQSPLSMEQMQSLPPDAFIYDLIYRPLETQLLLQAKELGLSPISGLGMLVHQGVIAFEQWTQQKIQLEWIPEIERRLIAAL